MKLYNQIKQGLRKLRAAFGKGDYFECVRLLCRIIPNWLFCLEKSYLLSFQDKRIDLKRTPKNFIFRQAEFDDLSKILAFSNQSEDKEKEDTFNLYFSQGNHCYAIEHKKQLVAYGWALNYYRLYFDKKYRIKLTFDEKTAFFWDGYIKPAYRLRGFFPVLINGMIEHLNRNFNKNSFFAEVQSSNELSLKSHLRLGFSLVKTYYYISIFRINYLIISNYGGKTNAYKVTKNMLIYI